MLARSFARIHETNLKKQGILALTFANVDDYDLIGERDRVSLVGRADLAPGVPVRVVVIHEDGGNSEFSANHTMSDQQVGWFRAGSALNVIRERTAR